MSQDRLTIDVTKDLKRIDPFITKLINNKKLQMRFLQDPMGVMIKLGVHKPTTDKAIAISNRIFYALLSNKKLMKLVNTNAPALQVPSDHKESFKRALSDGKILHNIDSDLLAFNEFISNERRLRKLLSAVLYDLNDRGLFTVKLPRKKLNLYIKQVIESVRKGKSTSKIPALILFGPHYGIGSKKTRDTVVLPGGHIASASVTASADTTVDAATEVEVTALGTVASVQTEVEASTSAEVAAEAHAEVETEVTVETEAAAEADISADTSVIGTTQATTETEIDTMGGESDASSDADTTASGGEPEHAIAVVEIAALATLAVGVEVAVPATVEGIDFSRHDIIFESPDIEKRVVIDRGLLTPADVQAFARENQRAAATLANLFSFINNLASFVQNIKNEDFFGKEER